MINPPTCSAGGLDLPESQGVAADLDVAVELVVDLGTSPHGLSAGSHRCDQETQTAHSHRPPAKPLLVFSFTESQRDALAFAALCEAEDLQDGHEADVLEVQEAIRNLWEARQVLTGAAS